MKKFIGLILVLCLVLVLSADAFAASKLQIIKQPETGTTSKNGTVSFEIKVNGALNSLTWYFVDPATGKQYTGKTVTKAVDGLRVSNPNSRKIKLSKVPESMHGWIVYCHINGNGYKMDSNKVMLLVYGLEPPENAADLLSSSGDENESDKSASKSAGNEDGNENSGQDDERDYDDDLPGETSEPESRTFTVSCTSKVLRRLNSNGSVDDGESLSSRLEFTDTGSFIVTSENPIRSYTINGIQIEPAEPVNEFKVLNVTSDITLSLKIIRASAAAAQVDYTNMCKITCDGCTFTYLSGGLRSVSEGEVPSGASINVIADSSDLAKTGYRINGAEPVNLGMASFRLVITEDTVISTR